MGWWGSLHERCLGHQTAIWTASGVRNGHGRPTRSEEFQHPCWMWCKHVHQWIRIARAGHCKLSGQWLLLVLELHAAMGRSVPPIFSPSHRIRKAAHTVRNQLPINGCNWFVHRKKTPYRAQFQMDDSGRMQPSRFSLISEPAGGPRVDEGDDYIRPCGGLFSSIVNPPPHVLASLEIRSCPNQTTNQIHDSSENM